MTLLGRWSWYLPRWLEWLPRVRVDAASPAPPRAVSAPRTPAAPAELSSSE